MSSTRSPGCGSTMRPTCIDPRDCGISRPRSNRSDPWASKGPWTTMPSGRPGAGSAFAPRSASAGRRSSRVVRSSFTRRALSAGSLSARMSATASSGPSACRHICASHSGCERRTGESSGSSSMRDRASRVARRITAFAKPAARGSSSFTSSTVWSTAARAGTASNHRSWNTPSRRASRTAGSGGRAASASITWSSVMRRWIAP